jgi:hypothetical protein
MTMREHPIIFSAPMVRAILEGRKTQTRRVVKPQPNSGPNGSMVDLMGGEWGLLDGDLSGNWRCPYGQPGDRLWCRETWAETDRTDGVPVVTYAAGGCIAVGRKHGCADDYLIHDYALTETPEPDRWRPSIHMPRWASRITLEITDVRVQRVQDISATDAWAEGIPHSPDVNPMHEFEELWDSINESRGFGWNANPYVWALTFRRVEQSQ